MAVMILDDSESIVTQESCAYLYLEEDEEEGDTLPDWVRVLYNMIRGCDSRNFTMNYGMPTFVGDFFYLNVAFPSWDHNN